MAKDICWWASEQKKNILLRADGMPEQKTKGLTGHDAFGLFDVLSGERH